MELHLYDLVVIYLTVKYPQLKMSEIRKAHPDLNDEEVRRVTPLLGITELWGNKEILEVNGQKVYWDLKNHCRVDRQWVINYVRGGGSMSEDQIQAKINTFINGHSKYIKPVPAGIVNKWIIENQIGDPLMYHTQYYRIAKRLLQAGWLVGEGRFVFTYRESARVFVEEFLDKTPPKNWPAKLEVEGGVPERSIFAR